MPQTNRFLFFTAGVLSDRSILQSRKIEQKITNSNGVCGYTSTTDVKQIPLVVVSPDNVAFKILVSTTGELITEQTSEQRIVNIVLQSKAKIRYEVNVDQDGSLITVLTNTIPTDMNLLILTDSLFNNYRLFVEDDGTLTTQLN